MVDQPRCKNCGAAEIEPGRQLNLCPDCRDTLARRPMPGWTPVVILVVALAMILAAVTLPASLSGAVAFERGRNLERAGNYKEAVTQYAKAAKQFPESSQIAARLGISLYHAGDFPSAMKTFAGIEGKELDKETIAELDTIMRDIQSPAGPKP